MRWRICPNDRRFKMIFPAAQAVWCCGRQDRPVQ